jgi:hypothetical protein
MSSPRSFEGSARSAASSGKRAYRSRYHLGRAATVSPAGDLAFASMGRGHSVSRALIDLRRGPSAGSRRRDYRFASAEDHRGRGPPRSRLVFLFAHELISRSGVGSCNSRHSVVLREQRFVSPGAAAGCRRRSSLAGDPLRISSGAPRATTVARPARSAARRGDRALRTAWTTDPGKLAEARRRSGRTSDLRSWPTSPMVGRGARSRIGTHEPAAGRGCTDGPTNGRLGAVRDPAARPRSTDRHWR